MKRLRQGFTYRPNQWKTLLLLAICTLFTAVGIWIVGPGDAMGFFVTIFFGLGCLVFLIQLLPGSAYLRVTSEGIEVCSLFRKHRILWQEVSEFGVIVTTQHGIPVSKVVGFNYTPDRDRKLWVRKVAAAMSIYEGALPNTYGFKAEDLAALLNQQLDSYWQARKTDRPKST